MAAETARRRGRSNGERQRTVPAMESGSRGTEIPRAEAVSNESSGVAAVASTPERISDQEQTGAGDDAGDERAPGRSLRVRLVLLTLAGTLVPIGLLGWLSVSSVQSLQKQVLAERQRLAVSMAAHIDAVLNTQFELLESLSPQATTDAAGIAGAAPAQLAVSPSALREDSVRSRFFSRVFVLDREGTVVQAEPAEGVPAIGTAVRLPEVEAAVSRGALEISPLWTGPDGTRRLFLMVAMRGGQGQVAGVAAGEIDPQTRQFAELMSFVPLEPSETAELVDQNGVVIASTGKEGLYREGEHRELLAKLIADQQPAASACYGCEGDWATLGHGEEVMAFAPLPTRRSWGLDIRQPQALAFGTTAALRWNLLAWAIGLGLLASLFALGVATSITSPLSMLVRVAGRIAGGELETPIPELGGDEVGRLGRALERMRRALRQSLAEVARGRDQLETRVSERTAEIERLYAELQQRERLRARLLDKVIGAQEEERRRIARELHDATSQEIGALVLALDTAGGTLPAGAANAHLREAKSLAVRALDGIHRLGFDLRPSVLDDLGLFRAIAWYAERDLKKRGISVRCEFEGEDVRLPAGVETALFRAVQEAITNIVRHARAESVLIQGAINARGEVAIEIEDDGEGFDPEFVSMTAENGRGLGLAGIRERLELLGGRALIESSPGHGTRVVLCAPTGGERG